MYEYGISKRGGLTGGKIVERQIIKTKQKGIKMKINVKERKTINVKKIRTIAFRERKTIDLKEIRTLNLFGNNIKVKRI